MTPAQVDRAKTLRDALKGLPTIKKWNGQKDAGRSGIDLQVNGVSPYVHSIGVDKATGRKIIAAAEKIIRTELRQLGVRLPRKP